MSYTPTDWKTDDVITAEKLNNMESGIAGAGEIFAFSITMTNNHPTINKVFGVIKTACEQGKILFVVRRLEEDGDIIYSYQTGVVVNCSPSSGGTIAMQTGEQSVVFSATDDNSYPLMEE